ncbi:4545_t:CDS:1, partial [Funneliformis geosporum]
NRKKTPKNPIPKSKLTPEEQFWEEVDNLAQEKIYRLLTNSLPLQNLNLITEP